MILRGKAISLLVALSVTGCAVTAPGEFLRLDADETLEAACEGVSELYVEELDTPERPGCVPRGATLVFPDGGRVTIAESGGTGSTTISAEPGVEWGYVEVGIYGVVATRYDGRCDSVEAWGRDEAVDRVREAFGDDFGVCE